MKEILLFLLSINFLVASGQTQMDTNEIRVELNCWSTLEKAINEFSDSLNFWNGKRLPDFLFNKNFDYRLRGYSRYCFSKDKVISYRKAIFDRVFNELALNAIVQLKDERLDLLYDPHELERLETPSIHMSGFPEIPYMEISTRRLAEQRLDELDKKREQFKN